MSGLAAQPSAVTSSDRKDGGTFRSSFHTFGLRQLKTLLGSDHSAPVTSHKSLEHNFLCSLKIRVLRTFFRLFELITENWQRIALFQSAVQMYLMKINVFVFLQRSSKKTWYVFRVHGDHREVRVPSHELTRPGAPAPPPCCGVVWVPGGRERRGGAQPALGCKAYPELPVPWSRRALPPSRAGRAEARDWLSPREAERPLPAAPAQRAAVNVSAVLHGSSSRAAAADSAAVGGSGWRVHQRCSGP